MEYLILLYHWIADFVCQTDEMAKNKSKSNKALGKHILAYTTVLFLGTLTILPFSRAALFSFFNGIIHFGVDYITSRITSKLYQKGRTHAFFVIIGLDQLVHTVILLESYKVILNLSGI